MQFTLIVCGIIQAWIILFLSYNEAIEFKMTNVVCESYNKSWMVINQCRLRAISRNKTTFHFNGTVLHPAYRIHVRGELFLKANGYRPWLFNKTIDGCRFIEKPFNPIAIIIFKIFREFTNFNHSCPYVGPQIVDGFYLRWKFLPNALPTGEYQLAITWLFDLRPQFRTNAYFMFKEDS